MIRAFVLILFVSLTSFVHAAEKADAGKLLPIRVGWQIPWATQGQIVQIWKKTDILKKNGLEATFTGRTYGPELNEIAMSGALDVVLTGDQPAINLISKNKGWRGIGRLMYNRTLTYVPPKSSISAMRQLKGKTIALPVGAAAERVTKEALQAVGIDPTKDVKIVNLDIREQAPLALKSKDATTFDQFDAMAGFDPLPAIFQSQGLIKVLDTGKVVSLVLMNEELLKKHSDIGQRVMQALFDAYDYYRTHEKESNDWFLAEAQLNGGTQEACKLAASLEPNLKAKSRSEMRVTFSAEDLADLQKASDFLKAKLTSPVDIQKMVDNTYAKNVK